uniref:2-oxoisovalerate dehydrogenase subunit alpha n=1 Tax=Thermosporothrix sp. COM3 TaxID=2490863 RepID=A0A455SQN3_9CHLR|nr:pyruvate dehydrogenase E1 component subunit alpha [Thermosporothrix sp. COM3]
MTPTSALLQELYTRMLLTRIVDELAWHLHLQGHIDFVASCRGHEAVQIGSAACIEVGKDFTLPYYRNLGVVLTIGMTPYEVFRTYLQPQYNGSKPRAMLHWGYHKHNTVTGTTSIATQILHAAGIAFACKLRKDTVAAVAYCDHAAHQEADFQEGLRFAAQHRLPLVIVCEKERTDQTVISLPPNVQHIEADGTNVLQVAETMRQALQQARDGAGPVFLEFSVVRFLPDFAPTKQGIFALEGPPDCDPLVQSRLQLQHLGLWDEERAQQLYRRLRHEVERALEEALQEQPARLP